MLSLSPKYLDLLRKKVESGPYRSEVEVIEEALTLLDDRDRLARLRHSIAEAEKEFEEGEYEVWSAELMQRIAREGDDMVRRGIPPDPDVIPS